MSVVKSIVTDRSVWLRDRQQTIGASEAAAVLGISPWESPRELYLRKRGILPAPEESPAMRIGTLIEPVIAQLYTEASGRPIVEQQVFLRSELDPMSATLDGVTDEGRIVEFKCVSGHLARQFGIDGSDHIPDHWLIQAHQQMLLHGSDRVDFAVLLGGTAYHSFEVVRNEEICQEIAARIPEFWTCVETGTPPPYANHPDSRIWHLLYPGCEGEIELSYGDQVSVDLWAKMGEFEHEAKQRRAELKGKLLEKLGNHATGRLPDGRTIVRKVSETPEQTIQRKGYTSTRLYLKGE